jgi:hypothetical protein
MHNIHYTFPPSYLPNFLDHLELLDSAYITDTVDEISEFLSVVSPLPG